MINQRSNWRYTRAWSNANNWICIQWHSKIPFYDLNFQRFAFQAISQSNLILTKSKPVLSDAKYAVQTPLRGTLNFVLYCTIATQRWISLGYRKTLLAIENCRGLKVGKTSKINSFGISTDVNSVNTSQIVLLARKQYSYRSSYNSYCH